MRKADKLTESLDFTDHQETVNYLFESAINGQWSQVRRHYADLRAAFNNEELEALLAGSAEIYNIGRMVEVLKYCGHNRVAIENIYYNHRRDQYARVLEILNEYNEAE